MKEEQLRKKAEEALSNHIGLFEWYLPYAQIKEKIVSAMLELVSSIEQKEVDCVTSDNNTSTVPCDAPVDSSNTDDQYHYFVSYYWNTKLQCGHGALQINCSLPVRTYKDIEMMHKFLNENIKDEYGNTAKCIVLNYVPLLNSTTNVQVSDTTTEASSNVDGNKKILP